MTAQPTIQPATADARPHAVALVSAADEPYARAAAVALLSAATSLRQSPPCILLDCGIVGETRRALRGAFDRLGVELRIERVDVDRWRGLPTVGHLTVAVYARLAAVEMAHPLASRTLYLDADTLTVGPLDELVSHDLDGCVVGAVADPEISFVSTSRGVSHWRELGLERTLGYFNSGVLLIDNERWQEADVESRTLRMAAAWPAGAISYGDQGPLNAVLARQWQPLEGCWNTRVGLWFTLRLGSRVVARHGVHDLRTARILHFAGSPKPWEKTYPPFANPHMYAQAARRLLLGAGFGGLRGRGSILHWAGARLRSARMGARG